MSSSTSFQPDWVSSPGETIAEILEDRAISLDTFADELGLAVDTAADLTKGFVRIDFSLAVRLERTLGPSASFWLNREDQFRADSARLAKKPQAAAEKAWLQDLPIRDMLAFGWIKASVTVADRVTSCLSFFGVSDIEAWHTRYDQDAAVAAFRMSRASKMNPSAVAAWLRWAELVAERIDCQPWDSERFKVNLDKIRRLTWQKDPSVFLPMLREICAACGVAVVVARTPSGCPASGATRFVSARKALMVLSFRYRTDDQFWFTFFHEAGHLLLHGHEALFLEDGSEVTAQEEAEANAFAARMLIPEAFAADFQAVRPVAPSINGFARKAGVAPGIVVGQLQHKNRVAKDRLNFLKRRYTWDAIETEIPTP